MRWQRRLLRFVNSVAGRQRQLIVNADDFGVSAPVSEGIIHAHQHGIVTSASLMVRGDAATQAAAIAACHPELSVGLHIDLGEWICRNQQWEPVYVVVDLHNRSAVADEMRRQLQVFRNLIGSDPTHIDSHQHVHRDEPVRSAILEVAAEIGVPVRHHGAVQYCGRFYGQQKAGIPDRGAISPAALIRVVDDLPVGVTELCCHPSAAFDQNEQYGVERVIELQTLCDVTVRHALRDGGVVLRSFHGLRTRQPPCPPQNAAS